MKTNLTSILLIFISVTLILGQTKETKKEHPLGEHLNILNLSQQQPS